MWNFQPGDEELLEFRLRNGWQPTASNLKEGDRVLGYAACVFKK